jgi:hypothetical protein
VPARPGGTSSHRVHSFPAPRTPFPALSRPLAVPCWMLLDVGCWMLDVGCWMLDVGCWMLDVGCWMLDVSRLRCFAPLLCIRFSAFVSSFLNRALNGFNFLTAEYAECAEEGLRLLRFPHIPRIPRFLFRRFSSGSARLGFQHFSISAFQCLPLNFCFLLSKFLLFPRTAFSISAFPQAPHDAHRSSSNLRSDPFPGRK